MGRLRRFVSGNIPELNSLVLIESGDREISEKLLPALYSNCPYIDLVTCFAGLPRNFDPARGSVYSLVDYRGRDGLKRLSGALWAKHYSAVGIICADQPIMTRWKWALAAQMPGKLFIVNENVDYFWVDRHNWSTIRHFALYRMGLSGADAVRTLSQLAAFPFTVAFLLLYAGWVHARRKLNA